MNAVRRVARNISYLFVCQAASRLLGLALNLVLARRLTDAGYGRYSLILVIVMIAGMAADFGTASILIREVSRRRSESSSLLGTTLIIRGVTTVIVTASVLVMVLVSGMEAGFAVPLMFATLALIPTSLSTAAEAALQGFERMDLSALADVVFSVALTAVGAAVVYSGGGVTAMTGVYLGASVVRLAYSTSAYRRLVGNLEGAGGSWRFSGGRLRSLVRESFPVLYWQLVSLAYYKVDVLLLGAFRSEAEVGWYAVAYKLFEVPVMFGWLAVQSLLPLMSRMYEDSKENLALLFEKVMKYVWIAGLGVGILMAVASGPVIGLLLPSEYEPAVLVLQVLGAALPFMAGCVLFGNLFISMELQRRMAKWSLLSLAVNLGLNLALIPAYGVRGAAVTTLVSEIFSFILFYGFTAHYLGHIRLVEVLLAPLLAAGIVLGAMLLMARYSAPIAAAAGIVLYPVTIYLFRIVSQDDLVYFRRLRTGEK
ncbi:MAG: oligosaccharide flippase family protein [Thermoleophilia bacterium]